MTSVDGFVCDQWVLIWHCYPNLSWFSKHWKWNTYRNALSSFHEYIFYIKRWSYGVEDSNEKQPYDWCSCLIEVFEGVLNPTFPNHDIKCPTFISEPFFPNEKQSLFFHPVMWNTLSCGILICATSSYLDLCKLWVPPLVPEPCQGLI